MGIPNKTLAEGSYSLGRDRQLDNQMCLSGDIPSRPESKGNPFGDSISPAPTLCIMLIKQGVIRYTDHDTGDFDIRRACSAAAV
jgi:hypothetical protein